VTLNNFPKLFHLHQSSPEKNISNNVIMPLQTNYN